MPKISVALLFFFLFLSLFSSNVFAQYTSLSGHDEEFSASASQSLLSYEHTGSSCFQKGWYASYQGFSGVVYFNSNCSAYTTHQFYLKNDISINWPSSTYPLMAAVYYYINTTANWNPDDRPSLYVWDVNASVIVEEVDIPTISGDWAVGLATALTTGHHYWLILDFKTWEDMPPVFIAVDKMEFGTLATPIFNLLEGINEMPSSCSLLSNTSYFYPFSNTTDISINYSSYPNYPNSYVIGSTSYKNLGQSFTIQRNTTLYGIGVLTDKASLGTYNLTLRKDSNNGEVLAYNSTFTITNTTSSPDIYNTKYLDIKLNTNVSLNSETTYFLQIYNISAMSFSNNNFYLWDDGGANIYTGGREQVLFMPTGSWCDSVGCGLGERDINFALQLEPVVASALPDAIQNNTPSWSNINYVEGWDNDHWDIYYSNASGNLSILLQGQIFRVVTNNGLPYIFFDCVASECGNYISGSTYIWPFEYTRIPEDMGKYIEKLSDINIIYGYNGITWEYYDPSNKLSSTLKILIRGQQFYIITKTGNDYRLGQAFNGATCDITDYSGRSYKIQNDCSITYGECPMNTKCSQITPQASITTPLIEDFTDCSMCWFLNSFANPNVLIWTNCPNNPECRCLKSGLCNSPNVYQTNISSVPFNVLEYTIGCYDPSQQKVLWIINSTGGNTTQQALINKSINITTETPSIKSENSIISLSSWINTNLGSTYASSLIAFFISAFFAGAIFVKLDEKKIEHFIVPFMIFLAGFSMPGVEFFPSWLLILLGAMVFIVGFYKVKGG